jgi:hypothetical protein
MSLHGLLQGYLYLLLLYLHRLRVFQNRVLRIFRLKKDEVAGGWRKLHNEELHTWHFLPNIIRIIKSRSMRLAGDVAGMGIIGMHIAY